MVSSSKTSDSLGNSSASSNLLNAKLGENLPSRLNLQLKELLPQHQIEVTMRVEETSWPEDDPTIIRAT